jgi:hypothetical protein
MVLPIISVFQSRNADACDLRLICTLGTEGAITTTRYRRRRNTDTAYAKSRSPEIKIMVDGTGLSMA